MESNLPLFTLPFVDSEAFAEKNKGQGGVYDELQHAHGSLLGGDDVLAQILTADGPLEEPDLNGPTTLHCEICNKQFDNAKKYYGHLRVHSGANVWVCDKCPDQKFSTKQQLMKHGLLHKPLQKVWRCPQCTKAFEALFQLQQHLFAKHFNHRPHKCDQCEKAFHKPADLKLHKDVHDENRRHACSECDRKFINKSNLKRHMLRHSSERPVACLGTSCKRRFKQVASMRRHAKNCRHVKQFNVEVQACPACAMSFQQRSALLEHCARHHPNTIENSKEKKSISEIADTNRTVENIVDDILSAEDEYMTMTSQSDILNQYTQPQVDNTDNLMQIEFLKDMNQLHTLDDELFYNDIDFDSFQTSHIFNTNEIDYNTNDRNAEIFFDLTENRSIDTDFMNALYHVKGDGLNDEILNVPELPPADIVPESTTVSVNECATIFETDVDLEASTNLAANLNQLIGENSVQYISTEDDDTFIISLNSEIDAEQLSDMLNIGVELKDDNNTNKKDRNTELPQVEMTLNNVEPIVVKVKEETKLDPEVVVLVKKEVQEEKVVEANKKKKTTFVCKECKKVFDRRYTFRSHIATHVPSLRRYKCRKCKCKFSYYSTLKKHEASKHAESKPKMFNCDLCTKSYKAKWMLSQHISSIHERARPLSCAAVGCQRRFYKKSDLDLHKRYHTGERPYSCDICARKFANISHLHRHVRTVDCTRVARKNA